MKTISDLFKLIDITEDNLISPEQKINTNETCPSCKGTGIVTPSINVIQEIENELSCIRQNTDYKKIYIKVHPFIASHIKKGLFSIEFQWKRKYGFNTKVVPSNEKTFLEYKFETDNHEDIIF